ncbi:MAG: LAGLIDADG family homing endonuclease, partial [Desulfitobacteriaceae bacterium]|nr:LAGLIDADG family homing endonuclease [Desulfitobacteriaceae bacterium]
MLNPDYIVGLVDGEGSFTVYIKNPNNKEKIKRRVRAEPRFYIKLIDKDKDILYEFKKFFGCGNVYFQKDTRPNH